jgi:hypothetical protein
VLWEGGKANVEETAWKRGFSAHQSGGSLPASVLGQRLPVNACVKTGGICRLISVEESGHKNGRSEPCSSGLVRGLYRWSTTFRCVPCTSTICFPRRKNNYGYTQRRESRFLQYLEGVPDRQAIDMLRYHAGWNFAVNREMGDPLFHATTLTRFRDRLEEHDLAAVGFKAILEGLIDSGLVKRRANQRMDSTHVLGLVSRMSRVECVRESLRMAAYPQTVPRRGRSPRPSLGVVVTARSAGSILRSLRKLGGGWGFRAVREGFLVFASKARFGPIPLRLAYLGGTHRKARGR